jgi:hypothetical protein
MCKPCTHIINVQITIDNVKLHSITILKYEMYFKLYALRFKDENALQEKFLIFLLK